MNAPLEESNRSASGRSPRRRWPQFILRVLLAVLVTLMFGRVLQFTVRLSQREGRVPGFGAGIAHGALMPCGFPMLLLGKDLPIYAERNTGRTYKLGYTLGVNLCGAVFFGSVYWRVGRLRRFARELQGTSPETVPAPPKGHPRRADPTHSRSRDVLLE